jgi:hypothetical protein
VSRPHTHAAVSTSVALYSELWGAGAPPCAAGDWEVFRASVHDAYPGTPTEKCIDMARVRKPTP